MKVITVFFSNESKVIIEILCPVLCIASSFLSNFFHKKNEDDVVVLWNDTLVDTICHRLSKPDACHILLSFDKKRSATNFYLSFDMFCVRIRLSLESIATLSEMSSTPTLITASSTTNSSIFFLLLDIFCGLYFCIYFHILTWLLWTILCNVFAVFISEIPRK